MSVTCIPVVYLQANQYPKSNLQTPAPHSNMLSYNDKMASK